MSFRQNRIILLSVTIIFLLFFSLEYLVHAASKTPPEIISAAVETLEEILSAEDSGAFKELLKEAEGIAIFPFVVKVALFGVGGLKGEGMVLRKDRETGV